MTNTRVPVPHPLQKNPVGIKGVGKNWFASTYFYSKLTAEGTYNYENVKRWTSKIDIFDCDKIIIPINVRARSAHPLDWRSLNASAENTLGGDSQVILTHGHGFEQESNTHWFLGCINFKEKRTEVYDGRARRKKEHEMMLRWLKDEHENKVFRVFPMILRAGKRVR